jgi:FG-GAP repeat
MTREPIPRAYPSEHFSIMRGDGFAKRACGCRPRSGFTPALSLLGVILAHTLLGAQGDPLEPVTFRSPAPGSSGNFGQSIAAMGSDRVLIGEWANTSGGAYLLGADGVLLKRFPSRGEAFGWSVAAVGTDRVLIGAPKDPGGAAYLLSTDGDLLATLRPPAGAGRYFGWSVAEVGDGLLMVGDIASTVAGNAVAGAAHLFRSDGTLLRTFTSPQPEPFSNFGWAVAALGPDRVIISARRAAGEAGVAYVFEIGGKHLVTIQNPQPTVAMKFGSSVAALGTQRILVGASDDLAGNQGGAAYLFSEDGTLLTTFSNPLAPSASNFGASVAAVGLDRVLIGAPEEKGRMDPGLAYLFTAEGELMTTLHKPDARPLDLFGWAVAALGPDRVLVTSIGDDTGANGAGAAYLFSVPVLPPTPPVLSIAREADTISVRWTNAADVVLQQSDILASPPLWGAPTDPITVEGTTRTLRRPVNTPTQSLFYRLSRP